MQFWGRVLLTFGCLVTCSGSIHAEKLTLSGQVVDEDGQPVVGVEFSRYWLKEKTRWKPNESFTTDPAGRFVFKANYEGRPQSWLAMDPSQTRGVLLILRTNRFEAPLRLRLGPLVTLRGELRCTELGRPPRWGSAYLSLPPDQRNLVQDYSDPPRFELKVPAGRYELNAYGSSEVDSVRREILVTARDPVMDLGPIDLAATPIGRHRGKAPPPWHVTAAQGAPRDVQPNDYLGRWLLVEYWGYW
ncbi:MAG TPA: carboxypeptidase-like regulatory domain-containing protein [Verrucomicrobiae bacterium]|nr:carboxypeptidase-like regulatory domain-containing protein [Verrucomicrobiae bacterium]